MVTMACKQATGLLETLLRLPQADDYFGSEQAFPHHQRLCAASNGCVATACPKFQEITVILTGFS